MVYKPRAQGKTVLRFTDDRMLMQVHSIMHLHYRQYAYISGLADIPQDSLDNVEFDNKQTNRQKKLQLKSKLNTA